MISILGISCFYHDSAAAIIVDGDIIAAAQEERFSRKKHDSSFPKNAIEYALREASTSIEEIDYIVFYEKPFLKFERLLETYVANAPKGFMSFKRSMPIWLREKLFQKSFILKELRKFSKKINSDKLLFSEHHESHASSAFYPSPFESSVILTLDGVGEWATTTVALGSKNDLRIVEEIHFPHSLGLLYSAFTYYLGFKVNSGEYKVMGLAPYGKPIFKNKIMDHIVELKEDGSFFLNQSYFNYSTGLTMTSKKFSKLFGEPVRKPDSEELRQFHMDIAASIQIVIEDIILKIAYNLSKKYNYQNLCLAGGVALNCVANSKIVKAGYFKNVWIQPASGDAGGALGAALLVWYKKLNKKRLINYKDSMRGSLLGPDFNEKEIKEYLLDCGAKFKLLSEDEIISKSSRALFEGKAIGWFQGKMEFGPRALGSRSIIASPLYETMQKNLNLKVKFRESFRPFAPSILREDLNEWYKFDKDSPYMLFVADVLDNKRYTLNESQKKLFGIDKLNIKRSKIPAVTHVDFTSRIQTVHKDINPKYYSLISAFKSLTGCAILVNTSFNVRGEPIVCTPQDAFKCFMGTGLDNLVIGNYFLYKKDQEGSTNEGFKNKYELD